ncbi:spondin domain-containing protein [bacterium]|nr:spondin domain-containing protein [bacterium]MDA7645533.1 spondin domain-containing protein [bacterium]
MKLFSHQCLPRVGSLLLIGLAFLSDRAKADVDQLWITEVVPSSGVVEVTNVGSEPVVLNAAFPFCHRFNYTNRIPAGTRFEAGESKMFGLAGLNATDSDLFLYRDTNFGGTDSIISGLRYGPETRVGASGIAASAGIWPDPTASTVVPSPGQSLALVGADPFSPDHWTIQSPDLGQFEAAPTPSIEVRVTIENLAPEQGTFLTPLWIGVHDGSFDSYDGGSPSSPGIERIAEDGNPSVLSEEFQASGGRLEAVLNEIGPIGPGQAVSTRLWLDPNAPAHGFLSYVAMVIPSNDAYVANGNPTAHALFDENGQVINQEILIMGSDVNDAGTEINDELPINTAFFGQSAPNTGDTENGVNQTHPGFRPASEAGILSDAMFASADFKTNGYQIARILIERIIPNPIDVMVTVESLSPESGTYLTPLWVGFHDGGFDSYDGGSPSTPGIERIAEDGNTGPLASEFFASSAGAIETTLNGIGPIAPGQSTSKRITLDANALSSRYFSYAGMIIPSNDAYVANGNPLAHPVFDSQGQFIGVEFDILGSTINDAGTEVNDELPANTAFFGQAAPNTGQTENGVNQTHSGFKDASEGGILADPMFANADFTAEGYRVARVRVERVSPAPIDIEVTIENVSPENGTYLTPLWVGFHNGEFDSYDGGSPSTPGIERIAEDGNPAVLAEEFFASGSGNIEATLAGIGPIAPGAITSKRFTIDAHSSLNQYLSYAAMVIPSNDAYVANGNPLAHALFDESGNFTGAEIMILGTNVNDAGTEINDEIPSNTAFFGQSAPNTGETENGVNSTHPGFKAADQGGILADPQFSNADFQQAGYVIGKITVRRIEPKPTLVSVTFQNSAPDGGTFQTPVWIGIHNGSFDLFDLGGSASEAMERLAEDGNTGVLSQSFDASQAGKTQMTVISNGEIPPFAPGDMATVTLELDANDPMDRYLSFASMVIPSNDAFVGNSDPKAYPIFDGEGNLLRDQIIISNLRVYDAGTEINDEIPENTAFLAQSAPNTGTPEDGVVTVHGGFNAAGSGGIVDQASFASAGVNLPNEQSLQISIGEGIVIESISANNNQVTVTWSGGRAPFTVQGRSDVTTGVWETLTSTDQRSATFDRVGAQQFLRIVEDSAFPSETARFSVTFNAEWSRTLHPTDFPGNPHFSGLIGATHNSEVSLWTPDGSATPGIQNMAETGGKSPLTSEIEAHQGSGTVSNILSGGGVGRSPGMVSLEFNISQSHPLVSLVSMIAPSPDWFVGIHGLNLLVNGNWADELVMDLEAYDAGTDSGVSFTSSNQATTPQGSITRVTDAPLDESLGLPPIGQFIFTRIE